ncbi:unnamed protein product [Periconia digitata]|uniref:Ketosynthase family 3 (KS3) domain-containing protein n=1 Tax=Periconia digitata TaxID=1303443 RepID=A0A9W4U1S5_9PLEO|nr:unnamed protein product [Periconia digitata]
MRSNDTYKRSAEPIAVIGTGCKFPGHVDSPSSLWTLLRDPYDVLEEIPPSRFNTKGYYHQDSQYPGHANVRHSYVLSQDISQFDAAFFNIKAEEADAMDPQHRILLETVYEGLESAGLTITALKGSDTGVFVGMMFADYEALQYRDLKHLNTYHGTGNARSIASNRVSYFFDWHGPSFTVDTACSSSLVALHQATHALRSGESSVAIVAGTNLLLGPENYVSETKLRMLSPEGRSRMWDADANGYARGEGVGVVVLKTLSEAVAAGDHIQCLIRETGVNQDGRSQGITMPRASAQAALIRDVYARAGLDITSREDRCQYFEAHGTGTPAGDPVEAEAIHTAFFGESQPDCYPDNGVKDPLYVGSIKTVIGHTESTAGIAGLLKVALAMEHGFIPPNMLLNRLNPAVVPFYEGMNIPQQLTPWPRVKRGQPRRASLNSFGFGGTNAHVIVESFQPPQRGANSEGHEMTRPFVFSAASKQSLLANLSSLAAHLEVHPDIDAGDLAFTLRSRRSVLPHRIALTAASISQLQLKLQEPGIELLKETRLRRGPGVKSESQPRLLGVFTGQGAQWPRMGAELIEQSPLASSVLEDLDACLAALPPPDRPSWTLRDELLAAASKSRLAEASIAQPVCTAVQIILVHLLRNAGVSFTAVVGHSSGEIAAAFAAGLLTAHDSIKIAYYRGIYTKLCPTGAMLAVGTTGEDALEVCQLEDSETELA